MRNKRVNLDGATVVLTGATRGIGRALSEHLILNGATVAAIARDSFKLNSLSEQFGEQFVPFQCDLGLPADRRSTIEALKQRFGTIDGLINNAAIQTEMSHIGGDETEVSNQSAKEIEINLTASVYLVTALMPLMSNKQTPFVVNVTSGLAIAPKEAAPVYSATKAGLRSFTKALRYQAQSSFPELCVTEVIMALVDTDMTQGRGTGKITADQATVEIIRGILLSKEEIWVGKAKLLRFLDRISPQVTKRILRA